MSQDLEVIIVGAGVAGLCCARVLQQSGTPFRLLEASDGVGGRVRSDQVEGFILDRGFQVLLTAYPEAREVLDYERLDLRAFTPGALVWTGDRLERVADPLRCPAALLDTLGSSVGSLADKLRMARLQFSKGHPLGPEQTTEAALRDYGFSERIIETLFRPWFGGVFLDRSLGASSHAFEFSFEMFSKADTAVPAAGMGAIAAQLAEGLPEGSLQLNTAVAALIENGVRLEDGRDLHAPFVVIATEAPVAARLLGETPPPRGAGVRTIFFDAPEPPLRQPILVLDGTGRGPANDLCVMSEVSSAYAPAGRALVSTSVLDHVALEGEELVEAVKDQMSAWFGPKVQQWRHLRTLHIEHALPSQNPEHRPMVSKRANVYVCGDHTDRASLQGAMVSGRKVATALLEGRASKGAA